MSTSLSTTNSNKDLEWSLDSIQQREIASEFVTKFESRLCVYSPSVEQFYTNYTINIPSGESGKMVILPNPYAFHDTFNGIKESAIKDTGLHIIPGETIQKKGLYLLVTYKNSTKKATPLPLKPALQKMLNSEKSSDPFLPLLAKGDLREFDQKVPCLHLHRLKVSELTELSVFEQNSIKTAIMDKLSELYNDVDNL